MTTAVPISTIRVGDFIQVAGSHDHSQKTEFAEVIYIPHAYRHRTDPPHFFDMSRSQSVGRGLSHSPWIKFIEVVTATKSIALRMTPDHVLPVVSKWRCQALLQMCAEERNMHIGTWTSGVRLIYAKDITPGSCLVDASQQLDVVTSSKQIWDQSTVHTVVTTQSSGLIVVDGIVVSSFSVNHVLVNMWYETARWAYGVPYLRDALASPLTLYVNELIGDVIAALLHAVILPEY